MFGWVKLMISWFTRARIFTICCIAIAALFGWGFIEEAGLPPKNLDKHWHPLIVFLIFFLLPFAKKIDFFQLFSFEANFAEVKKEIHETNHKVSDIREDIRYVISQQNALSASVQSNNQQQVNVHYDSPPAEQAKAALEAVANVEPAAIDPSALTDRELINIILQKPASDDGLDIKLQEVWGNLGDFKDLQKLNLSEQVVLLRVRVEAGLRRVVEPYAEFSQAKNRKHIPFRYLLSLAADRYPEINNARDSFEVFYRIASQAAHAAEVPTYDLETAIFLGSRLEGILSNLVTRRDN